VLGGWVKGQGIRWLGLVFGLVLSKDAKQTSKGLVFGAVVRCYAVVLCKDKVQG